MVDSGINSTYISVFRSDLIKLINKWNIGVSKHRVGLAQYNQDVKVEFLLNAFKTKQQTLAKVKRFRLYPQPNKPRNLGRAMSYANTHFFTPEAGGRAHQGSEQWLVIVSGKESDDPVKSAAHELRRAGITVAGMSAGASMDYIELLASNPHLAFDSPKPTLVEGFILAQKSETSSEVTEGEEHLP